MDFFPESTSLIIFPPPAPTSSSAPHPSEKSLISVIYNGREPAHDAKDCGETNHSANKQTNNNQNNIMAKKAVKSKASKPAPKKKVAAKKAAKKK